MISASASSRTMATSNSMLNGKSEIATSEVVATQPLVRLRYTIAEASSYSGTYEPHNILYDRPTDLSSRWSGAAVASIAPSSSPGTSSAGSGGIGGASSGGAGSNVIATSSSAANRSSSPLTGGRNRSGVSTTPKVDSNSSPTQSSGDKQYIILKLDKPGVLCKIHFGKYYKSHPCNLKDFKVYASQGTKDPHSSVWVRILRGGLRNDSQPEVFDTKYTNSEGVVFPVRYIKLVPLATHAPNYNFSVWHVALEGISDRQVVQRVSTEYQEHRESTAIRMILKHLRSRAYHTAFRTLLETCKLDSNAKSTAGRNTPTYKRPFEHPLVTQLFSSLMQGAWEAAEECLEKAAWNDLPNANDERRASEMTGSSSSSIDAATSLFASYVDRSMPKATWTHIAATDNDGDSPCGRGGHEMEMDSEKGIIWLYGGWDGSTDLADLWAFYIQESRWRCISRDVRNQGGPGPRSCHKMVFDPRTGFLYVLGKFVDFDRSSTSASARTPSNAASPSSAYRTVSPTEAANAPTSTNRSATRGFFLPPVASGTGEGGTGASGTAPGAASGGADNPRDFMDELFGSSRGGSTRLSTGRTSFLGVDRGNSRGAYTGTAEGSSPSGHDSSSARGSPSPLTGYESDFYRFSTRTERWDRLSFDTHAEGGPKLVFDHQMIIDPDTQLLYVFGGRVAHPDSTKIELSGMWKYDVIQRSWTFLFDDLTHAQSRIPSRVGHSMLLDSSKKGDLAGKRIIWILAGQRNSQYLADMWTYQPSTGVVREVCKDYSACNGPEGGFTQRASIDSDAREIYLFSGLVKKSKNKGEKVKSAFWIYNIESMCWKMVYQYGGLGSRLNHQQSDVDEDREGVLGGQNGDEDVSMTSVDEANIGSMQAFPSNGDDEASYSAEKVEGVGSGFQGIDPSSGGGVGMRIGLEPVPRYAAQLMYDYKRKSFYIFGGNPADSTRSGLRLHDLWSLVLMRPGVGEVLRRAKFRLRQQHFLELAQQQKSSSLSASNESRDMGTATAGWGAMQALVYLQTQVSQVVNHDLPEESQAFRKLMAHLLSAPSPSIVGPDDQGGEYPEIASSTDTAIAGHAFSSSRGGDNGTQPSHDAIASDSEGEDEEEEEMLSISQVLPSERPQVSSTLQTTMPATLDPALLTIGGKASALYKQRYQLFQSLLDFFPAEAIEPEADLLDCIEMSKLSF